MDEQHADALDLFDYYYAPARRHQEAMASQWDEYERAYFAEPEGSKPGGDDAWRSWFFTKYVFQQLKTLVAELAPDDDPTFAWEGRRPEQDGYAEVCDQLIGSMLQRDDYAAKRTMAVEIAGITGGCPVKVHWLYRTVERTRLTAAGPKTETFVVMDQPTMTLVDPRDFMYDTRAKTMSECRYAFHRMHLTLEELRERKRSDGSSFYTNLDELENVPGNGGDGGSDVRKLDNDYSGERERAQRDGIEVIEMWTRDRVIVRAAGTIIRDEPNPYWHGRIPFEVITLMPSRNDVWGTSFVWTVKDPQDVLHTLENAAMDALKLTIDPPLAVDMEDPENMTRPNRPGERFPSRSPKDALVPMRTTGAEPYVSEQAIQAQVAKLEKISGMTSEVAGQSSADTATQAALNQRQAKGRIGVMMRSIDASFARVAEMFLQLCQQYLDMSQPVRVLGAKGHDWLRIQPNEIAGLWDVRPKNSSERAVKELHRQNLMEAISALAPGSGIAQPDGKTVNLTPLYELLADSFEVPKDRIVVDAAEMRDQHKQDVLADGEAQQQVMQMQAPPPEAPAEPEPTLREQLQKTINYKDLPDSAQADLLVDAGLSPDGVEDDNRNPTRPNAGAQSGISEGLTAFNDTTDAPRAE